MKKTNLLWVVAMLLFGTLNFTACSDEEDEDYDSTNDEISISNLTGLWQSEYVYYKELEDGKLVEEGREQEEDFRIQFNADGTFSMYEYTYKYDIDSDSGEYNWEKGSTGKWTSDKNKINLIYNDNQDDDIEAVTIIELTTSELRLEWYWAEMETDGKFYEEWEAYSFKKIGQ